MTTFPTIEFWGIEARTGCSCCSSENHLRGPYKTEEDAQRRVAHYRDPKNTFHPLASQYARRGAYSIYKYTAEVLPDGRWIVNGSNVIPVPAFIEVAEDGSATENEKMDGMAD